MRKFNKLPKNAVPCDRFSYVGIRLHSCATHQFVFVYENKSHFYLICSFGHLPLIKYSVKKPYCLLPVFSK